MSDDTTHWKELREFAAVDLAESFVLSWRVSAHALLIDVDLFLCPEHSFYEKPRPSEAACFRPAEIEFPECTSLSRENNKEESGSIADMAAMIGAGKIDDLMRIGDGQYQLSGKFGVVDIVADRPILRLKNSFGN